MKIIDEIENDFKHALVGIYKLPKELSFGSLYCLSLLSQTLDQAQKYTFSKIQKTRIRVPNYQKMSLLAQSYIKFRFNLL